MKNTDEIDRRIAKELTELLRQWQAEIARNAKAETALRRKVWAIQDACPHHRVKENCCIVCLRDLQMKRGT